MTCFFFLPVTNMFFFLSNIYVIYYFSWRNHAIFFVISWTNLRKRSPLPGRVCRGKQISQWTESLSKSRTLSSSHRKCWTTKPTYRVMMRTQQDFWPWNWFSKWNLTRNTAPGRSTSLQENLIRRKCWNWTRLFKANREKCMTWWRSALEKQTTDRRWKNSWGWNFRLLTECEQWKKKIQLLLKGLMDSVFLLVYKWLSSSYHMNSRKSVKWWFAYCVFWMYVVQSG